MGRGRVLIADDEIRFRETLSRMLGREGFAVTAVEAADQALELLPGMAADVVLLDLRMPGMSGTDALPRILAASPASRVIVLTGHGDPDSARQALAVGAFDFLCKPCDMDVLVGRIGDAVSTVPGGGQRERAVTDIMIPIDSYTCVQATSTVREGIEQLKSASESFISSGLVMESGHRAVLVFDGEELVGVLTMRNLIQAVRPDYFVSADGSLNRALQYSPLFWSGLFASRVLSLESRQVREIMNPRPPVVDSGASLMMVAHLLCQENRRRVAVERDGRIVGVVREQELFHEISRLILGRGLFR